jgi:hypothetical protein
MGLSGKRELCGLSVENCVEWARVGGGSNSPNLTESITVSNFYNLCFKIWGILCRKTGESNQLVVGPC